MRSLIRHLLESASSIRTQFLAVLTLLGVVMMFGYVVVYVRQGALVSNHAEFLNNNLKVGDIPMKVETSQRLYTTHLLDGTIESYQAYLDSLHELKRALGQVEISLATGNPTRVYQRTLVYMTTFLVESVVKPGEFTTLGAESWADIQFTRMVFRDMRAQAQRLVVSYLQDSGTQHTALLVQTYENSRRFLIAVLVLIALGFAAGLVVTHRIIVRLRQLMVTATELSSANWQIPDITLSHYSELAAVASAFNQMKHDIQRHMRELSHKADLEAQLQRERTQHLHLENLHKETQLRALQVQMNPHFLFNTLNMISRTALLSNSQATIELIEAMSRILRYNLENESQAVPLEKELEVVRAYILIQKTRFLDRMEFYVYADVDTDVLVPPMILQPLVENAIVHGLKDKGSEATVEVTALLHAEAVEIAVRDNGCGMNRETLARIRRMKRDPEAPWGQTSIGLHNVNHRLTLFYGHDELMKIESAPGTGTTVRLWLPLKARIAQ